MAICGHRNDAAKKPKKSRMTPPSCRCGLLRDTVQGGERVQEIELRCVELNNFPNFFNTTPCDYVIV